mmetsp:Transcript_16317/g.46993  ORF Transcript_16317/g.46993 Transcript_16317/m.46993 type:complete len:126 (+) Transcript_16317:1161-1538(+)
MGPDTSSATLVTRSLLNNRADVRVDAIGDAVGRSLSKRREGSSDSKRVGAEEGRRISKGAPPGPATRGLPPFESFAGLRPKNEQDRHAARHDGGGQEYAHRDEISAAQRFELSEFSSERWRRAPP